MKKVLVFSCALIALVSVSCQKMSSSADNASKEVRTVVSASISDADELTKTNMDCASGKLTWAENDKIYIIAADTEELWQLNEFVIDNSSIDEGKARFTSSVDMSAGTYFAAFYGKKGVYEDNGWYVSSRSQYGTGLTYVQHTLPYIQPYMSSGPNTDYLIMRAVGSDLNNLSFVNLSSIMKFSVKDSKAAKTLSSIKVVCDNHPISGRFYGSYAGTKGMTVTPKEFFKSNASVWRFAYGNSSSYGSIAEGGSYGNAVLLSNINVNLTASEQYFYVVIMTSSTGLNNGTITVTFTPTEGDPIVKTMSSFLSKPGKVFKFATVDFGED